MNDLEPILALWRSLRAEGKSYVLATIIGVEGSSYRRPGTSMLIAEDGRRAGTVSGGCLEAEVTKRAWWLTESGPAIESYSTIADDGEMPYGSGCGGVVKLLLERPSTAQPYLEALADAFEQRAPLAIATVLDGPHRGLRAFAGAQGLSAGPGALASEAENALRSQLAHESTVQLADGPDRVWANYRSARTGVWIFSAGDDAKPLANMARELGWWVAVADGRAHLATVSRFPMAHQVHALPISDLPRTASSYMSFCASDAAVVMTHSFEQDSHILASLLAAPVRPGYIGVLGPQRRTRDLLVEAARLLDVRVSDRQIDDWLGSLHAPTGLELLADTPAAIALSILAEIQKVLTGASADHLRRVRAIHQEALRT